MKLYRKYNSSYTPPDEYGLLFYDWNNYEWNKFYNFMANCVKQYHVNNNKLYEYSIQNYNIKLVYQNVDNNLIEYFKTLEDNKIYIKNDVLNDYDGDIDNGIFFKELKKYLSLSKKEMIEKRDKETNR